jgi:hypothetical protein
MTAAPMAGPVVPAAPTTPGSGLSSLLNPGQAAGLNAPKSDSFLSGLPVIGGLAGGLPVVGGLLGQF